LVFAAKFAKMTDMSRCAGDVLLSNVFKCQACPDGYGFKRPSSGRPYYKFPPTIGAEGRADLLFIGINPRLDGNLPLYERIGRTLGTFGDLARNLERGEPYIHHDAEETHYRLQHGIVQRVYGFESKFEDHAAVTELFYCATMDTNAGLPESGSDCADEYLGDVLNKVQPKVIICLGERVLKYMQERFEAGDARVFRTATGGSLVICVPHPANQHLNEAGRDLAIGAAVDVIRSALRGPLPEQRQVLAARAD
jgi:uracil-DNA glycosylase